MQTATQPDRTEAPVRGLNVGDVFEGRHLKAWLDHLAGWRGAPTPYEHTVDAERSHQIKQYALALAEALSDVPATLRRLADEIELIPEEPLDKEWYLKNATIQRVTEESRRSASAPTA